MTTDPVAPVTVRKPRFTRRLVTFGVLLAALGAGMAVMMGYIPMPFHFGNKAQGAQASPRSSTIPVVKVVHPKRETSLALTVDQFAVLEPYFRADLRARASGIVRHVAFDIGDKVRKDEVLIDIDVPDTEHDVARCEALILQREQELKVSYAKLKDAKALRDVSAATIKQRLAEVEGAIATRDLKKRKFARYQELAAKGSIVGSLVEEEERDLLTSESVVTSTKANVERARADYAESESKVEAAAADIDLKSAQIVVARKELDRAKAIADYSKVRAPFDGVVVRRTVDPGSFVQNATTGTSEALISIARLDIVTVAAKFPDNVAPAIVKGMQATVTMEDLPGLTIPAHITRFAPSTQNADRTMRVEIDLFNGTEEEYRRLAAAYASKKLWGTKSSDDAMPVRAFAPSAGQHPQLLPGMTANIRLSLRSFGESLVLPSSTVYTRSGTSYIMVVDQGKTRQVPVRVQLNDGNITLVSIMTKRTEADGMKNEVFSNLTGKEEVVLAKQLELGEGIAVKSGLSDW
jgi:multidrug resistance efflux pump